MLTFEQQSTPWSPLGQPRSSTQPTPIPSAAMQNRLYARSRNDSKIDADFAGSSSSANKASRNLERIERSSHVAIRKKPVIQLSDNSDVPSPISPERSPTNESGSYYSAHDQNLRPRDGDDAASHAPPPSMGGLELARGDPTPSEVENSNAPSDLSSAVTVRSDRSQGLETFKAALDVFEGIRTSVVSVEDSAMMIKRLEKKADRSFKRTYMLGGLQDSYQSKVNTKYV